MIEIDNFEQIFYPCGTVQSSPSIFGRSRAERPRSQSKGGGHQGIFLSQKPQYIYIRTVSFQHLFSALLKLVVMGCKVRVTCTVPSISPQTIQEGIKSNVCTKEKRSGGTINWPFILFTLNVMEQVRLR